MNTFIWTGLGILGWYFLGAYILSTIDRTGELSIWKIQAPSLLVVIVNMLWPIVTILYLTKKDK